MRILKWLKKLITRKPRFVRIPDHVRVVGATFYVPEGMLLELGDYVVLERCVVIYGEAELDITPEQGKL